MKCKRDRIKRKKEYKRDIKGNKCAKEGKKHLFPKKTQPKTESFTIGGFKK